MDHSKHRIESAFVFIGDVENRVDILTFWFFLMIKTYLSSYPFHYIDVVGSIGIVFIYL